MRLRDILTWRGTIDYLLWKARGQKPNLRLSTNLGFSAIVRGRNNLDLFNFYEIFVTNTYQPPFEIEPASVRRILDLGGYVGYSVLLWLSRFPNSHITVYEPHPEHQKAIRRQIELNGWEDRVRIVTAAAGTAAGSLRLTDQGTSSTITSENGENTLAVPVRDLFSDIGAETFDLMKIDIEGSELSLIEDPRFASLKPKAICFESHADSRRGLDEQQAPQYLADKLRKLGYEVFVNQRIVWARPKSPGEM